MFKSLRDLSLIIIATSIVLYLLYVGVGYFLSLTDNYGRLQIIEGRYEKLKDENIKTYETLELYQDFYHWILVNEFVIYKKAINDLNKKGNE